MIPVILGAIGGYLIGTSTKEYFEDGGVMANGGKVDDVAEEIMITESDIWDKLNIRSGSQLESDEELMKKYKEEFTKSKALDLLKGLSYSEKIQVHDALESENYHTANTFIAKSGGYGEKYKKMYAKV